MNSVVKIGLEMHQQLDTGKLFCRCPSELTDEHEFTFTRVLHPVVSELGKVDRAAMVEARRGNEVTYVASTRSSCAVEWDEEPPHDPDGQALEVAAQIAKLLRARPVDEVQFMRKILIDGSAVTGFQRTALVATDGNVDGTPIDTVCLEEDSARPVKEGFSLDRLGIPLIEVATAPTIKSGKEAMEVAKRIGTLFRMARVKRGLGTIRQDLNVSIPKGARVEIKGVQDLQMIPRMVDREVERQESLVKLRKRFSAKFTRTTDVTRHFKGTDSRIFAGKEVFAAALKGAAGLFAETLHPGKHVGKELAEYVRSFGHGGFVHSDERNAPEELAKVRRALKAGKGDLVVLAAGDAQVIDLVKERVEEFSKGVPEDTRRAERDASTSFMRPLPTGARMYPETDIPPLRLPGVEPLETPEERLKRLKGMMPDSIARKLYLSPDYHVFEDLGQKPIAGTIVTDFLPALRRKGAMPTGEQLAKTVRLYEKGKLTKDGIFAALKKMASGKRLDTRAVSPDEVREFVRELVHQRHDYVMRSHNPVRGLMGAVMRKYRGKFPGKWVAVIISEEVEKLK
jgi:glutamyl-tRNA(Gln) amidotransferase subunit E